MIRRLIKESIAYSFSNIVSHGISLLLLPFFTRMLVPAEYGVIDILQIFTAIVKITVPLEIYQALARYYIDSADEREKTEYASNALWQTVANYLFFTVLMVALAKPLSQLRP